MELARGQSPPLFEKDDQINSVSVLFERAAQGRGGVVLVEANGLATPSPITA